MLHARQDYNERVQDNENRIPEDEPVVLLRAQDKLACMAIAYYAELCRKHQTPEVAVRMEKHHKLMEAWPKKKLPDVPGNM